MGLFSWAWQLVWQQGVGLTGNNLIWLTKDAKLKGIADEIVSWINEDALVIVVAHFPASSLANVDFTTTKPQVW